MSTGFDIDDIVNRHKKNLTEFSDLGAALPNMNSLLAAHDFQAIIQKCIALIDARPDHPEAHLWLALVLYSKGRVGEASELVEWIIHRLPLWPVGFIVGAKFCRALGNLERSKLLASIGAELSSDDSVKSSAFGQMAETLRAAGEYSEASIAAAKSLALGNDRTAMICSVALSLASYKHDEAWRHLKGFFALGIKDLVDNGLFKAPIAKKWDYSPVPGEDLYIVDDQGFGDMVQALRYIPRVRPLVSKVILITQSSAIETLFFSTIEIDDFNREIPATGYWMYGSDLITMFAGTDDPYPLYERYLLPHPGEQAVWGSRLSGVFENRRFRVALAWRGSPKYPEDAFRSIPLEHLMPILDLSDIDFVIVQKNLTADEAEVLADRPNCFIADPHLTSWGSTSGLLANVDVLVTVDTGVAHLAGAMGRSAFVLCRAPSEWRWAHGGRPTPWYRSVSLFRQQEIGNWRFPIGIILRVLQLAVNHWPGESNRYLIERIRENVMN